MASCRAGQLEAQLKLARPIIERLTDVTIDIATHASRQEPCRGEGARAGVSGLSDAQDPASISVSGGDLVIGRETELSAGSLNCGESSERACMTLSGERGWEKCVEVEGAGVCGTITAPPGNFLPMPTDDSALRNSASSTVPRRPATTDGQNPLSTYGAQSTVTHKSSPTDEQSSWVTYREQPFRNFKCDPCRHRGCNLGASCRYAHSTEERDYHQRLRLEWDRRLKGTVDAADQGSELDRAGAWSAPPVLPTSRWDGTNGMAQISTSSYDIDQETRLKIERGGLLPLTRTQKQLIDSMSYAECVSCLKDEKEILFTIDGPERLREEKNSLRFCIGKLSNGAELTVSCQSVLARLRQYRAAIDRGS